ncbi:hypothetical protein J6590_054657, partial [Homalodisca vitripennis]
MACTPGQPTRCAISYGVESGWWGERVAQSRLGIETVRIGPAASGVGLQHLQLLWRAVSGD